MGTDPLIQVLSAVHHQPRRLHSNICRYNAYEFARLASCGLITTAFPTPDGPVYGQAWRCTLAGLRVLDSLEGIPE